MMSRFPSLDLASFRGWASACRDEKSGSRRRARRDRHGGVGRMRLGQRRPVLLRQHRLLPVRCLRLLDGGARRPTRRAPARRAARPARSAPRPAARRRAPTACRARRARSARPVSARHPPPIPERRRTARRRATAATARRASRARARHAAASAGPCPCTTATAATDCASGQACVAGSCTSPTNTCKFSSECDSGKVCADGQCLVSCATSPCGDRLHVHQGRLPESRGGGGGTRARPISSAAVTPRSASRARA